MPSYKQIWRYLLIGIISSCVCCLAVTLNCFYHCSPSSISPFTRFLALFARFPCNLQRNTVIICTKSSTSSCCCDFSVLSIISISQLYKLVHRFFNPRTQSAWYLYQCKAEERGDAVASLTDGNAAMMQITSAWYIRN